MEDTDRVKVRDIETFSELKGTRLDLMETKSNFDDQWSEISKVWSDVYDFITSLRKYNDDTRDLTELIQEGEREIELLHKDTKDVTKSESNAITKL